MARSKDDDDDPKADPKTKPEPDPPEPPVLIAHGQVVQTTDASVILRTGMTGECSYDVKSGHDATPGSWVSIYSDGSLTVDSPSIQPRNIPVPMKPEPPEAA
jgi:hypothetical protein